MFDPKLWHTPYESLTQTSIRYVLISDPVGLDVRGTGDLGSLQPGGSCLQSSGALQHGTLC